MKLKKVMQDERGIALVVALLVALVVAAISVGAAMLSTHATTINRYTERLSTLELVAEAGLEEVRSQLNGNRTLYPDSGYNTIGTEVSKTEFIYTSGDYSTFDYSDAQVMVWPGNGNWNWFSITQPITDINFGTRQITV